MFTQIFPHLWMHLPREERLVLADHFKLVRTGITEVKDQTVITDGYTTADLSVITAEAMAEFVGSSVVDTSFTRLWEITCAKAHSIVNPPVGVITSDGLMDDTLVAPPYGEKTCEICGCKMAGPGVDENTVCAEEDRHPPANPIATQAPKVEPTIITPPKTDAKVDTTSKE
jgi:hypothetical protein